MAWATWSTGTAGPGPDGHGQVGVAAGRGGEGRGGVADAGRGQELPARRARPRPDAGRRPPGAAGLAQRPGHAGVGQGLPTETGGLGHVALGRERDADHVDAVRRRLGHVEADARSSAPPRGSLRSRRQPAPREAWSGPPGLGVRSPCRGNVAPDPRGPVGSRGPAQNRQMRGTSPMATTAYQPSRGRPELPVVAEAVAARLHDHHVRRGGHRCEQGRRGRHVHRHQDRAGGHVQLGRRGDGDGDDDQRRGRVGDELAQHGDQHEQAGDEGVRAGVAHEVHEPVGQLLPPRRWTAWRSRAGSSRRPGSRWSTRSDR